MKEEKKKRQKKKTTKALTFEKMLRVLLRRVFIEKEEGKKKEEGRKQKEGERNQPNLMMSILSLINQHKIL